MDRDDRNNDQHASVQGDACSELLSGHTPEHSQQKRIQTYEGGKNNYHQVEMEDMESKNSENHHISNRRGCLVSPLTVVIDMRRSFDNCFERHYELWKAFLKGILLLGYTAYVVYAMIYRFGDEGSLRLLVVTILVLFGYICHKVKSVYGTRIVDYFNHMRICKAARFHINKRRRTIERCVSATAALSFIIYIVIDVVIEQPRSLMSAVGLFVIVSFMFFFSKDPSKVKWRTIFWGLFLQLIFALIVLRTNWGYFTFEWLGSRVTEFIEHSTAGAIFVFGENFREHFFAFKVMPVIVFFSSIITVLYYLGWLQTLMRKIAVIMEYSLGTSAMESLHAALNIFLGWGETLTFIRPLLDQMTLSELHTVMTNGLATVAGSTLAVYILYGFDIEEEGKREKMKIKKRKDQSYKDPIKNIHSVVGAKIPLGSLVTFDVFYRYFSAPANHLLSASVMSAPAALAISKLFYPEDKKRDSKQELQITGAGLNIVDAASVGAIAAISIVSYVIAEVIAFISILSLINSSLAWFGERVGLVPPDYPTLSFQLICSYVFWPLVYIMGVDAADCLVVGRMVGIKTFINEFFAYEDLGKVIRNGEVFNSYNGTWHFDNAGNIVLESLNTTLIGGVISKRSEVICTYALCGFSNFSAIGIMIGVMTAVAPSRRDAIVSVSFRALVSACMACFITACVAGLLTR